MSLIELYDESGNKKNFRLLDTFGMDDEDYAVLLPEGEEDSTYILRIEIDEDGLQYFVGIEDDDELNDAVEVYEELKRENMQ